MFTMFTRIDRDRALEGITLLLVVWFGKTLGCVSGFRCVVVGYTGGHAI